MTLPMDVFVCVCQLNIDVGGVFEGFHIYPEMEDTFVLREYIRKSISITELCLFSSTISLK